MEQELITDYLSVGFIFNIFQIIIIFIIIYYFYRKGYIFKIIDYAKNILDPKNIKINNREKNIIKEKFGDFNNFNSILYDTPPKELILNNPRNDLISYNIGSGLINTYPVDLGIFFSKYIYPLNIIETKGSIDNIIELFNYNIDFAFVDEDILTSLYSKKNNDVKDYIIKKLNINDKKFNKHLNDISCLFPLYYQYMITMTIQGSNINTWNELDNKIVGVTDENTNSFFHLKKLLIISKNKNSNYNFTIKKYENLKLLIDGIKNGEVDAIFITSNQKNKYIRDFTKDYKVRFISFRNQQKQLSTFKEYDNYNNDNLINNSLVKKYFSSVFKKNINLSYFYNNINFHNHLDTYSTRMILICRNHIEEDSIKILFDNYISNNKKLKEHINKFESQPEINNSITDAFNYNEIASINKIIKMNNVVKESLIEHNFIKVIDSKQSKLK